MCGFFKVTDSKEPDKERRLYSLFLIKHKKKQQNLDSATQRIEKNEPQPSNPIDKGY